MMLAVKKTNAKLECKVSELHTEKSTNAQRGFKKSRGWISVFHQQNTYQVVLK
jgi:hypothetical protein